MILYFAATASSQVRLADIRTGSTAHILRGEYFCLMLKL